MITPNFPLCSFPGLMRTTAFVVGRYLSYIFRRFTTGSPIDGTHWLPNKEMALVVAAYVKE